MKPNLKLHLACGINKQKGFVGVDSSKKHTQADIVVDLLKFPWKPFKDSSIEQIFCAYFLNRIPHLDPNNDGLFQFMNEIYRILKPGATVTFVNPYYTSQRAVQDPTVCRFISEGTFLFFNRKWREVNKAEQYPISCDFEVVKIDHSVSPEYKGRATDAVQQAAAHSWNVIDDMLIVLKKLKS